MSYYPFSFVTRIVTHDVGYLYTVVFLAEELHDELPLGRHPRLRVRGEVGEVPFEGAWQPSRGRWYLMLSKQLMRAGDYAIGDEVEVRFLVADQDAVDVPEDLGRALAASPAAAVWEQLSTGKRRGLAIHVSSAKTAPTRERRVAQVLALLTGGEAPRSLVRQFGSGLPQPPAGRSGA